MILKKCPHCGGPATIWQNRARYAKYGSSGYFVYIKCDVCGCQTGPVSSETEPAADDWENQACEKAASIWNLRTTEGKEGD